MAKRDHDKNQDLDSAGADGGDSGKSSFKDDGPQAEKGDQRRDNPGHSGPTSRGAPGTDSDHGKRPGSESNASKLRASPRRTAGVAIQRNRASVVEYPPSLSERGASWIMPSRADSCLPPHSSPVRPAPPCLPWRRRCAIASCEGGVARGLGTGGSMDRAV